MIKSYRCILAGGAKVQRETRDFIFCAYNSVKYLNEDRVAEVNIGSNPPFVETDHWKAGIQITRTSEAQNSATALTITACTFSILDVTGVWLATDPGKVGTNYYTGGSFTSTVITLGTALPGAITAVIIDYVGHGTRVAAATDTVFSKTVEGLDDYTPSTFVDEFMSSLAGSSINMNQLATTPSKDKLAKLEFDISAGGTMPAGTIVYAKFYDAAGTLLGQREKVLPQKVGAATEVVWFPASEFLGASYVTFTGTLMKGGGATYDCRIRITIYDLNELAKGVKFTNSGLITGVNQVLIEATDEDFVALRNSAILDIFVAGDEMGNTVAAATALNGIAINTYGALIEPVDDIYILGITEEDGKLGLALTPTTPGDATYTELVIGGVPVNGDFVTFGADIFEFNTGAVTAGHIKVDTTGCANPTQVGDKFVIAWNAYGTYGSAGEISVLNAAGTIQFTARKYKVRYNSLATTDTEVGVLLAFADTTFGGGGGASTVGVDPADKYWLCVRLPDGRRITSDCLPYAF